MLKNSNKVSDITVKALNHSLLPSNKNRAAKNQDSNTSEQKQSIKPHSRNSSFSGSRARQSRLTQSDKKSKKRPNTAIDRSAGNRKKPSAFPSEYDASSALREMNYSTQNS